jgi:hypothetical protein
VSHCERDYLDRMASDDHQADVGIGSFATEKPCLRYVHLLSLYYVQRHGLLWVSYDQQIIFALGDYC